MTSKDLRALTPDQIAKFPAKNLPQLVSAATALDLERKRDEQLLDLVKERLIDAAARQTQTFTGQADPLSPVRGTAEVTFPDPKLITSIWIHKEEAYTLGEDKKPRKLPGLQKLCGKFFDKLFHTNYKPASKVFRDAARTFCPETSEKLIELCTVPSSPRVTFKP